MRKPPELYLIREPEAVERKVLQFPTVRSLAVTAQQHAWRDRVHQLTRKPVKPEDR